MPMSVAVAAAEEVGVGVVGAGGKEAAEPRRTEPTSRARKERQKEKMFRRSRVVT